jgi:hypothetical protein
MSDLDSVTNSLLEDKNFDSWISAKSIPNASIEIKGNPLANETFMPIIHPYGRQPDVDFRNLWNYVESSPEMQALLDAMTNDILSDGWMLEGGRNQKLKAEEFLAKNNSKQLFKGFLWDAFVTGNAYLFKSGIKEIQVKEAIARVVSKSVIANGLKSEHKSVIIDKYFLELKAQDEDIFTTRKLQLVASSTMRANFDQYGNVKNWVQSVVGILNPNTFTAEEIVHFRLLHLNGKFYGYTPMRAATSLIDLIADIRDYARYYFEKGGDPPRIYILKDATMGDPTYRAFEKAVSTYAQITNKYKSLVITGDVDVKDINVMNKDMEFRELAVYITQVMIMMWGVPPSRVPNVIMSNSAKQDITTTDGYYRKIAHIQDIFEDLINSQVLDAFKVKLKFNRTYKQDEIREVQVDMFKADVVDKLLSRQIVNQDYVWNYLKIEDKYKGKFPDEEERMNTQLQNTNRQNQMPNQSLNQSQDKQADDKLKQSINIQRKSLEKKGLTPDEIEDYLRNEYFSAYPLAIK